MEYREYIKPELMILIPVLYFIGIGLKKSGFRDKFIPLVLGGVSIVLSLIWVIATEEFSGVKEVIYLIFTAVTQGVLLAGSSVYINQIYLQSKKEE